MKKIFILYIIAFFIYSCSEEKDIPEEVPHGSVEGVVLNEFGQPIENTILEMDESATITDSQGKFNFERVKTGVHTISAFQELYLPENNTIEVKKDSITKVAFKLKAGSPYLRVSDTDFEVSPKDGSIDISLESNSAWIVKSNSSWIKVLPDKGSGNSTIRLSWLENRVRMNTGVTPC